MISWDGSQSPDRYSAGGRVWPGKIILFEASFILIFLCSSNDKEVDVKCDGQGNALGDFAGRTGTVAGCRALGALRQALSSLAERGIRYEQFLELAEAPAK
jgi:hypothetical protein